MPTVADLSFDGDNALSRARAAASAYLPPHVHSGMRLQEKSFVRLLALKRPLGSKWAFWNIGSRCHERTESHSIELDKLHLHIMTIVKPMLSSAGVSLGPSSNNAKLSADEEL
jgi:hypothetical protein